MTIRQFATICHFCVVGGRFCVAGGKFWQKNFEKNEKKLKNIFFYGKIGGQKQKIIGNLEH